MALNVLPSSSAVSDPGLVRLYAKALLHWLRHYADENDIEVGSAIINPDLPTVDEAHTLLDASIPADIGIETVLRQIDAAFAGARSSCARVMLRPELPEVDQRQYADAMALRGYVRNAVHVLLLEQMTGPMEQTRPGLTIIPARASFRHAIALAQEMMGGDPAQSAESLCLHLDDPHYDAVIALDDQGHAVASAGILAVGEAGLLRHLFVTPAYRRRGIGRLMLARAMDICERSVFRHVLAATPAGNEPLGRLLSSSGFRTVGDVTLFRRPDDALGEL